MLFDVWIAASDQKKLDERNEKMRSSDNRFVR